MKIVPYRAEHMDSLILQDAQSYMGVMITPEYAKVLEGHTAFSAIEGDVTLACAGVINLWPGRAMSWALLAPDLGQRMPAVHKAAKRFLDVCGIRRVEATVDVGFVAGHRWIKMLGFRLEAQTMRGYRPDGGACSLYARVTP